MEFLKESHPERLHDHRLTIACADAAAEAYEYELLYTELTSTIALHLVSHTKSVS
jgi:hypothetical protein